MNRKTLLRIFAALLLVSAVVAVYLSPLRQKLTVENIRAGANQISSVWYGPIAFIFTYATASVLFIPASLFVVASGVIWGWKLGGLYAIAGGTLGAIASYWTARALGGDVLLKFGARGQQLARQMQRASFKTLILFRVVPLFPFPVVNYAAGAVRVPATPYSLSSFVGLIPSAFAFAYIGDVVRFAYDSGSQVDQKALGFQMFVRLLIVGLAIAAVVLLPALLKKRAAASLGANEE